MSVMRQLIDWINSVRRQNNLEPVSLDTQEPQELQNTQEAEDPELARSVWSMSAWSSDDKNGRVIVDTTERRD